ETVEAHGLLTRGLSRFTGTVFRYGTRSFERCWCWPTVRPERRKVPNRAPESADEECGLLTATTVGSCLMFRSRTLLASEKCSSGSLVSIPARPVGRALLCSLLPLLVAASFIPRFHHHRLVTDLHLRRGSPDRSAAWSE